MGNNNTQRPQPQKIPASEDNIQRIEGILNDIRQWPDSWKGDDRDLIPGNLILGVFIHYLNAMVDKGRARATVTKHGDYLWALGGEIIRNLNDQKLDPNPDAYRLILNYVDNAGGPYWRHANSEDDLRQFDSVCRALYKCLTLG